MYLNGLIGDSSMTNSKPSKVLQRNDPNFLPLVNQSFNLQDEACERQHVSTAVNVRKFSKHSFSNDNNLACDTVITRTLTSVLSLKGTPFAKCFSSSLHDEWKQTKMQPAYAVERKPGTTKGQALPSVSCYLSSDKIYDTLGVFELVFVQAACYQGWVEIQLLPRLSASCGSLTDCMFTVHR